MIDEVLMRVIDVLLAFPGIILALVVIGALGPGVVNTVIAISLVGWLFYARVARAATLSIREKDYIEGARAMGCSDWYICLRYILPNCLPPINCPHDAKPGICHSEHCSSGIPGPWRPAADSRVGGLCSTTAGST